MWLPQDFKFSVRDLNNKLEFLAHITQYGTSKTYCELRCNVSRQRTIVIKNDYTVRVADEGLVFLYNYGSYNQTDEHLFCKQCWRKYNSLKQH